MQGFVPVIKSFAPWVAEGRPQAPRETQECIFFPRPNGLLIESAYLYLTQKNPKVRQQQGDIEPISSRASCRGGGGGGESNY